MRIRIHPDQQIQRINHLLSELESFKRLPSEKLKHKTNQDSWSILEVAKHISIAHQAYRDKVNKALKKTTSSSEVADEYKCSSVPSFLIKRFPPKEGKIKFKMKTMKQFMPLLQLERTETTEVFDELENCLKELKEWVNHYRRHPISMKKFNSAIGPIVRFNVPEACEFILGHNERHFFQMKNNLKE